MTALLFDQNGKYISKVKPDVAQRLKMRTALCRNMPSRQYLFKIKTKNIQRVWQARKQVKRMGLLREAGISDPNTLLVMSKRHYLELDADIRYALETLHQKYMTPRI
jgi:hypothetical protein